MWNITLLWLFILSLPFFSILSTGQTAALVHTLNGSNDVLPRKEVPLGVEWRPTPFAENMTPKTHPKWAWIGNFKPKLARWQNRTFIVFRQTHASLMPSRPWHIHQKSRSDESQIRTGFAALLLLVTVKVGTPCRLSERIKRTLLAATRLRTLLSCRTIY